MTDFLETRDAARARGQLFARGVLALLFVLAGLWTLHSFLPALAWAGVFAIALWPLYRRALKRFPPGRHKVVLPFLFTLGVALIFAGPLALVAGEVVRELHSVMDWFHQAQDQGIPVPGAVQRLPFGRDAVTAWWGAHLAHPHPTQGLAPHLDRQVIVGDTRQIGAAVAHRLTLFGFMLLTLFVLFKEGHDLTAQLRTASRRAFGDVGERIGEQIIASIHGTVTGLVLVGLAEGVALGIAYLVAGLPHPVLAGMVSALAAIFPFGATVAVALAGLVLAGMGKVLAGILLFGFGVVLAFLVDHFVRPVLIGGATKLPFLWVLLGILGGLEVWGLLGLFFGPAIMAALILLWRDWVGRARTQG